MKAYRVLASCLLFLASLPLLADVAFKTSQIKVAGHPPKTARRKRPPDATMKKSIGMDNIVLVRDARNATRRALFFSSSVAGVKPRIFFWLGQMRTHTLKNMMRPSHAPMPMGT